MPINFNRYGRQPSQVPEDMRRLLGLSKEWERPDLTPQIEEYGVPQSKRNITTIQRLLEEPGGQTEEELRTALEPTREEDTRSFLEKAGHALDMTGAYQTRKYGVAPLLEETGLVEPGRLTGLEDVYGTDIVSALRGKDVEDEQDLWDTVLGLGTEILTDWTTYSTLGAGAGVKLFGRGVGTGAETITKILNKKGGKVWGNLVTDEAAKAGRTYADVIDDLDFTEPLMERMVQGFNSGALGQDLIDKGGLKLFGKSLIEGKTFRKGYGQSVDKLKEIIESAPRIKRAVDAMAPGMERLDGLINTRDYGPRGAQARLIHQGTTGKYHEESFVNSAKALGGLSDEEHSIFSKAYENVFRAGATRAGLTGGKNINIPKGLSLESYGKALDNKRGMLLNNFKQLKKEMSPEELAMLKSSDADMVDSIIEMRKLYHKDYLDAKKAGVGRNEFIQWFLPHIYDIKGLRQPGDLAQSIGDPLQAMKLDRKYPTYNDAIKALKDFGLDKNISANMNPMELYAAYHMGIGRAIANAEYIDDMKRVGLKEISDARQLTKLHDMPRFEIEKDFMDSNAFGVNAGGRILYGNETTINALKDVMNIEKSPKVMSDIGNQWRKLTNWQKKNLTVIWPSFHVRNLYSDQFRVMQRALTHSIDGRMQGQTMKIMTGAEGALPTAMGDIPFDDIRGWYEKYGLMSYDVGRSDVMKTINETLKDVRGGTKIQRYTRWMTKKGAGIQNHSTMLLFTGMLKEGKTPAEAAQETFKFIFNYNLTTKFDKTMKNVIPFWSWMRLNSEFQLKRMAQVPGQRIGMMRGIDAIQEAVPQALGVDPLSAEEEAALPEYQRENITIPFWRTAEGKSSIFYNLDLPIGELNEIFGGGFGRTVEKLASRTHPLPKAFVEYFLAKRDLFFGSPIDAETTDLTTGKIKRPFERMSGFPTWLSALPGLDKTVSGEKEVLTMDTGLRKLLEGAGVGRYTSEARKLFEIMDSPDAGKAAWKLADILGGFKQKPTDLRKIVVDKVLQENRQGGEVLSRLRRDQLRKQRQQQLQELLQ